MFISINTNSGKYIRITNGNSYPPYIEQPNMAENCGNLRYNSSNGHIEVYDGYRWLVINKTNALIELTSEAESLLDWAKKKRNEEENLKRLAKSNITIASLLHEKKTLEEKIEMICVLTNEILQLEAN